MRATFPDGSVRVHPVVKLPTACGARRVFLVDPTNSKKLPTKVEALGAGGQTLGSPISPAAEYPSVDG